MLRASLVVVLVACTDAVPDDGLEITGTYTTPYASTYVISDTEVSVAYAEPDVYAIAVYDNDARYIVAENASTNSYNAGLWSRFDWTWVGEDLYICQQVFDAASAAEAEDAAPADPADPAAGGCGSHGFAFTLLSPG